MSLPGSTPVSVRVGPHPETGVTEPTPVVALGRFDHENRTESGSYSAAVYAVATGDTTKSDAFADRLRSALATAFEFDDIDCVVVVPSHDGGTNPALADAATRLSLPSTQAVRRTTPIDPNKSVTGNDDRWTNVADSLSPTTTVAGDTALVVDDVLASGASLGTTAATLRETGAATVLGAVLGLRTPNPHDPTPVSDSETRRTN